MKGILLVISVLFSISSFTQPPAAIIGQIDSLAHFIRMKDTESLAQNIVYRGEDSARKWKDVCDPTKPEERRLAKSMGDVFKRALEECLYRSLKNYREEEQSEGRWHIVSYTCQSGKTLHLAFLKIRGRFVLGDVDMV